MGTYQLEIGDAGAAKASFDASLKLSPSVHAYRNLAIFAPSADAAAELYQKAWARWAKLDAGKDPAAEMLGKDLSSEMAAWLMLNSRWTELENFLSGIENKAFLSKDRVLHARAALAIELGDHATGLSILTRNCFPTYGSVRSMLIDLWWRAKLMEAVKANNGKNLTRLQTVHLRRQLGCDGDSTSSTILDPCTRGPPNLGLRYGGL